MYWIDVKILQAIVLDMLNVCVKKNNSFYAIDHIEWRQEKILDGKY